MDHCLSQSRVLLEKKYNLEEKYNLQNKKNAKLNKPRRRLGVAEGGVKLRRLGVAEGGVRTTPEQIVTKIILCIKLPE